MKPKPPPDSIISGKFTAINLKDTLVCTYEISYKSEPICLLIIDEWCAMPTLLLLTAGNLFMEATYTQWVMVPLG